MIATQFVSRILLNRERVESFDRYPLSLPAVKNLDHIEIHPKMTLFMGENGSGKSTLIEAIAVSLGFNPEGGTKNFAFGARPSHSELHRYVRVSKGIRRPRNGFFLRAERFFNVATEIERLDSEPASGPPLIFSYGGKSLHEQSHGESFLALLTNRFGDQGFYLLDEPEAALSPQRQLAALSRIHDLIAGGSQLVMATHSAIFMAYPEACTYQIDAKGIRAVAYEDTEHYQVTRAFLNNPARMLKILFERGTDDA